MSNRERVRIAFVLGELAIGGAEVMLWKLVTRMDPDRFEPVVIALSARTHSYVEGLFRESGVDYRLLGLTSGADLAVVLRLAKVLRELAPDIVQGWMYYGNLAATLASALTRRRACVLWNIRGTLIDQDKRLSRLAIWLSGKLSFGPDRIVNNSLASAIEHERRLGFPAAKRVILPNGFDIATFCPSADARRSLRAELKLADDALLVGLIGRYHPMKDHANFVHAARLLAISHPCVHYVLAGEEVHAENRALTHLLMQHDLGRRVHLLGPREDVPRVTAALDISVLSSSSGEGFPNVIGEAMSCGVPCVVTDVGDSALIVGDTGRIVPPRDVEALARALADLVDMEASERAALGMRARERIAKNYSLASVVQQYEQLYFEVQSAARAGGT